MKSLEGHLYILVKKLSKYKNKILIVEKFGGAWISRLYVVMTLKILYCYKKYHTTNIFGSQFEIIKVNAYAFIIPNLSLFLF